MVDADDARSEPPDDPHRRGYLGYTEMIGQLSGWAKAHPALVRLETIGQTPEGRDLVVAIVGRDPDRPRPAAWIDANMHASELCGTNVCLGVIEDLLALHRDPSQPPRGLSTYAVDVFRESLVYVMPRISPDGAEAVLTGGRFIRSVPRHAEAPTTRAYWRRHDLDGDGRAMLMRVEHPAGEFVPSSRFPDLMVRRTLDDDGPYYHLYPEGTIEQFDGEHVPEVGMTSDNGPDLNRNFPYHWAPEPRQVGAGRLPLSEPESRAVAEYVSAHPHIYGSALAARRTEPTSPGRRCDRDRARQPGLPVHGGRRRGTRSPVGRGSVDAGERRRGSRRESRGPHPGERGGALAPSRGVGPGTRRTRRHVFCPHQPR